MLKCISCLVTKTQSVFWAAHSRRKPQKQTTDVRVDVKLNKQIWSRGIRSVPRRVRVRIAHKRNDEEDAKEELYSLVTVAEIPAEGLKGLGTKVIEEDG